MNVKVLVAGVLLVGAVAVGLTSFKKTMTPYITFREARATNGQVQVNGVLADKDYVLKADEQYLQFHLGTPMATCCRSNTGGRSRATSTRPRASLRSVSTTGTASRRRSCWSSARRSTRQMNEKSQAAAAGTSS